MQEEEEAHKRKALEEEMQGMYEEEQWNIQEWEARHQEQIESWTTRQMELAAEKRRVDEEINCQATEMLHKELEMRGPKKLKIKMRMKQTAKRKRDDQREKEDELRR